jgi:hypothetical protein
MPQDELPSACVWTSDTSNKKYKYAYYQLKPSTVRHIC